MAHIKVHFFIVCLDYPGFAHTQCQWPKKEGERKCNEIRYLEIYIGQKQNNQLTSWATHFSNKKKEFDIKSFEVVVTPSKLIFSIEMNESKPICQEKWMLFIFSWNEIGRQITIGKNFNKLNKKNRHETGKVKF